MENGSDRDRRNHRRIPVRVRVRVRYSGDEFTSDSRNLSAGGILLESNRRIPVGTRVWMQLTVPVIIKYPIHAEGVVVRLGGDVAEGLAIRFTEISDEDRELLGEVSERYRFILGEG